MNVRIELIDRKTAELGEALELFYMYENMDEVEPEVILALITDLKEKALTLKYLLEEEIEVRKSANQSIPPKYLEAI